MTPFVFIVVGLSREARIAAAFGSVIVGARALASASLAGASGLISFGLCGALDPAMRVGDLIVADAVVGPDGTHRDADAAWTAAIRTALPSARGGAMAASAVIVDSPWAKASLRRSTGAVAVDMESHAVAIAAAQGGLPFAVVRAVSDSADQALPRAAQAGFKADGEPDVGAVVRALASRPWELPALIGVAMNAERAFRTLANAAGALKAPKAYSAGSR